MQWLKARGASPITLRGHSLGANRALSLAVESHDAAFAALVLLSPMTTGLSNGLPAYRPC